MPGVLAPLTTGGALPEVRVPPELTALADAISVAAQVDLHRLSAAERADRLLRLRAGVDALEAAFTATLAVFDTAGDAHALDGTASTTGWLVDRARLAPIDAAARVRVARAGHTGQAPLAAALDALAEGRIGYEHVRAVASATSELDPEPAAAGVRLLVDLATQVEARRLRLAGRHLRQVVDPDRAGADAEVQFDARRASFAPLTDGMWRLELLADPEGAAVIGAALDTFMAPVGGQDRRTPTQRRYDALVTGLRTLLESGLAPVHGGVRPQLMVLCTPDALAGRRGAPPATLPDGTALAPASLQRLACDAGVARVLLEPSGRLLDLGRTRRLFSSAQRLALAVRDRGCRFPGCRAPWTEAHHVVPWQVGGRTDLAAAVQLCAHHHRAVHDAAAAGTGHRPHRRGGWTIRIDDPALGTHGPLTFTGPSGQQRTSHPPGADARGP